MTFVVAALYTTAFSPLTAYEEQTCSLTTNEKPLLVFKKERVQYFSLQSVFEYCLGATIYETRNILKIFY